MASNELSAPKPNQAKSSTDEFWLFYLREHSNPWNRRLHYVGSTLALLFIGAAVLSGHASYLILAPLVGYGFAWSGHYFLEHNRPATIKAPLLSLVSDYRMLLLAVTGRLEQELERAIKPTGSTPHHERSVPPKGH